MRRMGWAGAALAGLLVLTSTGGVAASDGQDQDLQASSVWQRLGAWRIVGTWSLQITMANCQTGDEIPGATFPGLNTFLAEGSMLSDPASNPALLRTGHGVWAYAGGRSFTNVILLFRFNPDGTYAGTQTVSRNITVSHDSDEFIARDTVTFADPAGNVVDTRCGVGRGRRMAL